MLMTIGIGLSTLPSSSTAPQRQRLVSYIGGWPQPEDVAFAQFLSALSAARPTWRTQFQVQHVDGGHEDLALTASAIRRALHQRPALLVLPTGSAAQAARPLLGTTPAVFATYTDPQRDGIVPSLTRPGDMTGLSLADLHDELRLDLLREAFPGVRRIAVIGDRAWADLFDVPRRMSAYATRHGVAIRLLIADEEREADAAMTGPAASEVDAWYVPPTFISYVAESAIRRHVLRLQRPAIYGTQDEVRNGGQMAYAQDTGFAMPALASLTLRVLDGERPQDIPVQRPHRFVLAVRISDEFPRDVAPAVVRRADVVYHGPAGR